MVDVAQLVRASVCGTEGRVRIPSSTLISFCKWDGLINLVSIGPILFPYNNLEDLMKLSYDHKLLLFKHSTRCSISSMAKNRIEVVNQSKIENCFLLDLISYREISDKIESIFQVKHESPQVLIIKDGKCIQHLSHMEINWSNIN